jgi:cytochrome P450
MLIQPQDLEEQVRTTISSSQEKTRSKAGPRTIFHELADSDLPAEEKTLERLRDDGASMVGAGLTTTAHFLDTVTYYILADKAVHQKLTEELRAAIPDPAVIPSLTRLEQLPYLRAVINEGHRFSHGVSTRLQRLPHTPLTYREWTIPARTPVSMSSLIQHRDRDLFPSPEKFDPQRWLGDSTSKTAPVPTKYLVHFSKGTRQCLGMNLAQAEILLTLATVFRRFENMKLYKTTARDVEVVHDYFIPHGHADSEGVRVIIDS